MTTLLDLLTDLFAGSGASEQASAKATTVIGKLRGDGVFESSVVGESHYQDALSTICGGRTASGHKRKTVALLVLEDDNPHDSQAVRVVIEGYTVGYLSRALAREYRQSLEEAGHTDGNLAVDAIITGGWDRGGGDMGHFGVKLDISGE